MQERPRHMAPRREEPPAAVGAAAGARDVKRRGPGPAVLVAAVFALVAGGAGIGFALRQGYGAPKPAASQTQAASQDDAAQTNDVSDGSEKETKTAPVTDMPSKEEPSSTDPVAEEPAGPAGWVEDADGVRRYYDPATHEPATGWIEDGGKRYYLAEGGVPEPAGWLELDGSRYYLADDGSAQVGWQVIDELTYCFDETGALMHGWAEGADGGKRWLKEDGTMASHEWVEIDGVWKVFGDNGAWVQGESLLPQGDADHLARMGTRQRAVVESCPTTPFQGKGWCGAWVTEVFARAGEPTVTGNACDLYDAWCLSGDIDDLRPGMLVAVPSHPQSENGKIWGHVCVYVGDGMVWDNGSYSTRIMALGDWVAWFGASHQVRWGWANGIDLEAV